MKRANFEIAYGLFAHNIDVKAFFKSHLFLLLFDQFTIFFWIEKKPFSKISSEKSRLSLKVFINDAVL